MFRFLRDLFQTGLAVVDIVRKTNFGPSFEFSDRDLPPFVPPFDQTGELEFSVKLGGPTYRWHPAAHLQVGPRFYQTFEDGPWKWDAPGRFAGKGINCGVYFGLTPGAADAEAEYYGMDRGPGGVLLQVEFSPAQILD